MTFASTGSRVVRVAIRGRRRRRRGRARARTGSRRSRRSAARARSGSGYAATDAIGHVSMPSAGGGGQHVAEPHADVDVGVRAEPPVTRDDRDVRRVEERRSCAATRRSAPALSSRAMPIALYSAAPHAIRRSLVRRRIVERERHLGVRERRLRGRDHAPSASAAGLRRLGDARRATAGRCTSSARAAPPRTAASSVVAGDRLGAKRAHASAARATAARARERESPRPPQLAKPEDAGRVTVGEVDADAVVADEVHVADRDILGHGLRIEQALAGRLGLAVRARALDAQLARRSTRPRSPSSQTKRTSRLPRPMISSGMGMAAWRIPPPMEQIEYWNGPGGRALGRDSRRTSTTALRRSPSCCSRRRAARGRARARRRLRLRHDHAAPAPRSAATSPASTSPRRCSPSPRARRRPRVIEGDAAKAPGSLRPRSSRGSA